MNDLLSRQIFLLFKQCKKIQKANSKKDEASPQNEFLNEALEEIIMESRLGELLKAIETILDERVPIIKSQRRFKQQTQRGSRFRGVSKNGSKWQVLVMDNHLYQSAQKLHWVDQR